MRIFLEMKGRLDWPRKPRKQHGGCTKTLKNIGGVIFIWMIKFGTLIMCRICHNFVYSKGEIKYENKYRDRRFFSETGNETH
jgi:hypothetical protein